LIRGVLGLNYETVRARAVKIIGAENVERLEKVLDILKTIFIKGPAAIWEMMKKFAGGLKDKLLGKILNWAGVKVAQKAIVKITSMFIPGLGFVQAILGIWQAVKFFIEKGRHILSVVMSIFNSVKEIAAGQVDKAAQYICKTIVSILPLVFSFLARLVGLGDIGKTIMGFIKWLRKPVFFVIEKTVKFLWKLGAGLVKFVKKIAGKIKSAVVGWWKKRKKIKTKSGEEHELFFELKGGKKPLLMVASKKLDVTEKLNSWETDKRVADLVKQAKPLNDQLNKQKISAEGTKGGTKKNTGNKASEEKTETLLATLSVIMGQIYEEMGKKENVKAAEKDLKKELKGGKSKDKIIKVINKLRLDYGLYFVEFKEGDGKKGTVILGKKKPAIIQVYFTPGVSKIEAGQNVVKNIKDISKNGKIDTWKNEFNADLNALAKQFAYATYTETEFKEKQRSGERHTNVAAIALQKEEEAEKLYYTHNNTILAGNKAGFKERLDATVVEWQTKRQEETKPKLELVPNPALSDGGGYHAEMNLIEKQPPKVGSFIYISKDCCVPCAASILIDNRYKFKACHGQIYNKWKLPNFIKGDDTKYRKFLGQKTYTILKSLGKEDSGMWSDIQGKSGGDAEVLKSENEFINYLQDKFGDVTKSC
ncbi:MAG: hypothetical protein GY757_32920, partial [bacterium]|nr:hypothetical protein [bacterium]